MSPRENENSKHQQATQLAESARYLHPEMSSLGIESYSDAHSSMGGGVPGFLWFNDLESLLAFVCQHLIWSDWASLETEEWEPRQRQLTQATQPLRDGIALLGDLPAVANAILRGYSQIVWAGTFEDISQGDTQHAREIRDHFRENTRDEEAISSRPVDASTDPISTEELYDFAQYLQVIL